MPRPTLYLLGMPLDEEREISSEASAVLSRAAVIVGENRKIAMRYLKRVPGVADKEIFFLDPFRKDERERLSAALRRLSREGGTAALFSDTGMPCLFDPGIEVLEICRKLGFVVRSTAGPTSWGMAAALSGFAPPFLIVGFPPRDPRLRVESLRALSERPEHCVLMDTPYRFTLLLKQSKEAFGPSRAAFLAWEIAKDEESLLWGSLADLEREAGLRRMEKGEFILIIHSPGETGRGRNRH